MGGVLLPLPVDPGPDLDELAEVDLRVEVGGEILAVAAGVDIQDVDGVDLVEVAFDRQGAVGVDHARIEPHAEDGGQALLGAAVLALPLVVGVPGRLFADLVRILVDGGVHVDRAGLQAGFEHRHVDEGGPRLMTISESVSRISFTVAGMSSASSWRGIERLDGSLRCPLPDHALDDLVALGLRARGDADVAQHVVVHGRLVRRHMRDAAGADDQYVFLHGMNSS